MKKSKFMVFICAAAAAAACLSFTASAAEDVTIADDVDIDETNFPDEKFRDYVSENYDTDKNGSLSAEEIEGAEVLSFSGYAFQGHLEFDMTGVENFKKLKSICLYFDVINADLSEIEALTDISFTAGSVSGLVLGDMTSLEGCEIYNSDLTELSLLDCPNLTYCNLNNNTKLARLEIKNAEKLSLLDCRYNALVNLKIDNCERLNYLHCSDNKLTKLDITNCPNLICIECNKNMIAELDITPYKYLIESIKEYEGLLPEIQMQRSQPLIVDSGTKVIGNAITEDDSSESNESTVDSEPQKNDGNAVMLIVVLAAIVVAGIVAAVVISIVKRS